MGRLSEYNQFLTESEQMDISTLVKKGQGFAKDKYTATMAVAMARICYREEIAKIAEMDDEDVAVTAAGFLQQILESYAREIKKTMLMDLQDKFTDITKQIEHSI